MVTLDIPKFLPIIQRPVLASAARLLDVWRSTFVSGHVPSYLSAVKLMRCVVFERDPVVEPGAGCTNPNATANIKCAYWGGPVTTDTATYNGTLRSSFQVAIAGSNGYTTTAYQTCAGYTGPTYLGTSAMNAPLDCNGKDTYMGYKLFIDTPFDPRLCSAACDAQTAYNFAYPPSDGTKPKACTFFNTYLLSKNGINQGQYCSMYTQAWSTKYATNDGQWRGTDHYTISYSFSFGNSTNSGNPVCPSDISYLQSSGSAFCTSYIGYTPPAVTQSVTQTKLVTVTAAATAFAVTTPAASTVTTTVFGKTITAYVRKRQATADAVDPEYSIAVETVRMTDTEKAAEYASLTAAPASATGAASDTTASSDTISVSDTTITSDTAASSDTIFVSDTTITSALSPTSDTSSTSTSDAVQRRAIATPAAITSWTPSQISSACSLVATGKTTVTVTSSTVTVTAATQTVVQTVYSGAPRPVTTVTTTVTSTYHLPAVYPTAIAGGANTLVSFDDDYFALTLPFAIGLYGTYSKSVFLSVNGFLSMTAPQLSSVDHALPVHTTTNRTTYLPDITAAPFWNDLFINPSLSQGIYYRITGLVGSRVVFFEYIVGSHDFPLADMYSNNYFTMTFYEDRPGYVFFNYQFINGNGVGATVGVQKASTNQFLQYSSNQAIVTVPMYLVIDTVAGTLVLNG